MDPAGAAAGRRGTVLVCDDTESIRRLLRINLELDGFEVIEACDGGDAVAQLDALARGGTPPHVVVLDADMAPFDGWWALDEIRRRPGLAAVPVVLASAANDLEDGQAMRERGLDAWVNKPFDPDAMLGLVDGFLREGRAFRPQPW